MGLGLNGSNGRTIIKKQLKTENREDDGDIGGGGECCGWWKCGEDAGLDVDAAGE